MKTLVNFINESKNPAKGGFKVGDKLWVLDYNHKNPTELTIKSIIDISTESSTDEYRLFFSDNDIKAEWMDVYTGDIEYDEMDMAYCRFSDIKRLKCIIFGRSKEDLKDTLDSTYGPKIEKLTNEINDKQEEINKLQDQLNDLLDKVNI